MNGSSPGGSVTRRLRDDNALALLHHVWDLPVCPDGSEPGVTGTELMAASGLSRATVHDVCEELIGRGWLRELPNYRATDGYTKGRPARRYGFVVDAGAVVGVDAGQHRIAVRVADLRGRSVGEATTEVHQVLGTPVAERLAAVEDTLQRALAAAGRPPVLAVALGIPAPVGAGGRTEFSGNPWWELMNPALSRVLAQRHGWTVLAENDANLAALAEGWTGSGQGVRHLVTLLAGERIGAGVVDDGRLLRGARGGVGEMRYLDIVAGVGSADGLGKVLRDLATQAGAAAEAEEVLAAAAAGEAVALSLVQTAGERLARVVVTLASLFDPELVVLSGGAAGAREVVDVVNAELPAFLDPPRPLVVASALGRDVVVLGAVRRALDEVQATALTIALHR